MSARIYMIKLYINAKFYIIFDFLLNIHDHTLYKFSMNRVLNDDAFIHI